MGFLRLLKQSIIFGTRSRRLFIFIFIFAILTGVTLFAMDSIFQENTTDLLTARSIVMQTGDDLFNNTAVVNGVDGLNDFADDITRDVGNYYLVKYLKEIPNVYIFSLKSNPWMNPEVQPNDIKEGHYVSNFNKKDDTYQILASIGSVSSFANGTTSGGPYSVTQDISVGNILDFSTNGISKVKFEVVGLFNKTSTLQGSNSRLWIFVPDEGFNEIVDELYPTQVEQDSNVFVSHAVLTAKGSTEIFFGLFQGNANDNLDRIDERITAYSGSVDFTPQKPVDTDQVRETATTKDIGLLFGGLGSTIVATMYAFLIARFRTREIATLKAVGYTARQARIVLLAEIGTVSVIGYILSTFAIQILLTLNTQVTLGSTYVPNIWIFWEILDPLGFRWLPSISAIFTFLLVVLSNIIGFFIISRRTVTVRPVELFRADA